MESGKRRMRYVTMGMQVVGMGALGTVQSLKMGSTVSKNQRFLLISGQMI